MHRRTINGLSLGFLVALYTGWCGAASHGAIDKVLMRLQAAATPAQYQSIAAAIDASPALAAQLDGLAASGKLADVAVVLPAALRPPNVAFKAYASAPTLVISSALLPELVPKRLFDVVREGDILPNNLVFVLGHLASHLQHRDAMLAMDADMKRQIASMPAGAGTHEFGPIEKHATAMHIENEAAAYIQGWNDVVDAARTSNAGKPLSVPQAGALLMNLRYRAVFLKAVQAPDPIHLADSGNIEPDAHNIKALAAVLGTSELPDIE
jgi:hypothetical protein